MVAFIQLLKKEEFPLRFLSERVKEQYRRSTRSKSVRRAVLFILLAARLTLDNLLYTSQRENN